MKIESKDEIDSVKVFLSCLNETKSRPPRQTKPRRKINLSKLNKINKQELCCLINKKKLGKGTNNDANSHFCVRNQPPSLVKTWKLKSFACGFFGYVLSNQFLCGDLRVMEIRNLFYDNLSEM